MKTNFLKKNNEAFTVLFAVIVSTLVLALGLGIVAITMKEVRLSGAGRDSQLAYYAADSGLECAMFYDINYSETFTSSVPQPMTCNGQSIEVTTLDGISTFDFKMESGNVNKPCVTVVVTKSDNTKIEARGYNTCNESNPRRLERGYSVEYVSNEQTEPETENP